MDIVSLLIVLVIIYGVLVTFTILLVRKIYRTTLVKGVKVKEKAYGASFNYSKDYGGNEHVLSYFKFQTKNNEEMIRSTHLFPMCKKGKSKLFLYSEDKDEIIAKIFTLVWQSFFFVASLLYSALVGIPFFIAAIIIVIVIIFIYVITYRKNIKKLNNK